jgi:hypothetical protein
MRECFFGNKGIHFHKGAKMKISLSYEQNTATVIETVVETVANLSKNSYCNGYIQIVAKEVLQSAYFLVVIMCQVGSLGLLDTTTQV